MSKGVISSHGNLIAMVQTIVHRFGSDDGSQGEQRFICTIPMFHIYGLAAFASGILAYGSTIIVPSKFEMHEMMSAIGKYQATFLPIVPILVAMINAADQIKAQYDLSSLHTVLCGGAPLSKEVTEGFTDTVEESRKYGTAGKFSASMEGRIVDPVTGQVLGLNKTGELWLEGPSIMKGYFSNEEATSSTLDSEGWLRIGDLCYIDEEGFIFVVDRLKELIKYKGYKVAPAELEALFLTHPKSLILQ